MNKNNHSTSLPRASQMVLMVKNPLANAGNVKDVGLIPGSGRCTGVGNGFPLPVFLPGKFHGQRSPVGCIPWGCKESDMIEQVQFSSVQSLSRVRLFATPWTVAYQAPPSMEFPRQEYWNGLPFPSPGDLPNPGIEPRSPASQADTNL